MTSYSQSIARLEYRFNERASLLPKIKELAERVEDMNNHYAVMLEAQQLLSVISEENTNYVLDYITGVINKALCEIFPYDAKKVYLEKSIHAGKYPNIKVKVTTQAGEARDIILQCGSGERQVISFLFVVCLIELRRCRRILLMDEILNNLHSGAKKVIQSIMSIFAEEGFQFIFVEHGGMENFGRRYIVEKPKDEATVTLLEGEYNNEIFVYNRPVEEVDYTYTEQMTEDEVVE